MAHSPYFSIVIPVYNRPGEVEELLQSLTHQTFTDFEVLIIEDGSTRTAKEIYEKYSSQLTIHYFFKPNSGPGPSRNFGFQKASGKYFVIFDSDCIVPPHYLETVQQSIASDQWDAWGGPDRGHEDFTIAQRAMAYTMSSVLTTGGIRGGKKRVGDFQPRSFNMGMSRAVYEKTGGFKFDRFAEDIELSIRMKKAGFKIGLIPEAYVYHKRRSTFKEFFKQVSNFGKGRVLIGRAHGGEVKLAHWFPFLFSLGFFSIPFLLLIHPALSWMGLSGYSIYSLLIFVDAWRVNKSFRVAFLSIPSAWIQLVGYGRGFISEFVRLLRGK